MDRRNTSFQLNATQRQHCQQTIVRISAYSDSHGILDTNRTKERVNNNAGQEFYRKTRL